MKLLFVTPFFRVPADFGIGIRNFHVLKHVTENHDVTVITYGEDETGNTDQWLNERGAEVVRLPYALPWSSGTGRVMALRNLFHYPPAPFQRFSASVLSDAIESCLTKNPEIDLVIFDTELTGHAALTNKFDRPQALIVHDIYAESLRRQYQVTGWRPHKFVRLVDWLKTAHYERRVLARFENLITVSRADEAYLKRNFPRARVFFSSNGVDTESFSRNGYQDDGRTLLFVAAFEYEPNVDAFFYFCREILPLVRKVRPDAKFVAAGRNPSAAMREYALGNPNVEVTGTVADVRPYYGQASVVVLPLRIGSGMKLKTLEAFAMGVPVVSTSVGVEGIEAEDGVHCAVATETSRLAQYVIDFLSNPESAKKLAESARALVEERYGWGSLMNQLETELVKMIPQKRVEIAAN